MKKLLVLFAVLVCGTVMMTSCGGSSDAEHLLDEILERGTVVMVTSPDWPPFTFLDLSQTGQAQFVGADAELGRFIAQRLGVELEILSMDFAASLLAVQTGMADMFIGGLAWRADRAEVMDLTDEYNPPSYQGIMVRAEDADRLRTLEDFNHAGMTVAGQNASLQLENVLTYLPDASVQIVATIQDGILQLQTGRIDALAIAGVTGESFAENYPDVAMSEFRFSDSAGNVIALPNNSPELLARINEIIAEVNQRALFAQWFDEADALNRRLGE